MFPELFSPILSGSQNKITPLHNTTQYYKVRNIFLSPSPSPPFCRSNEYSKHLMELYI